MADFYCPGCNVYFKNCFVNIIKHQDKDVLSRQIFDEQVRLKLPGLAKECEDICQKWGLKNIIENKVPVKEWKRTIQQRIMDV